MHNTEVPVEAPDVQLDIKCSSCQRAIQSSDWVRRAKENVYHLACFSCDVCKQQLSTGEEFALIDEMILCKLHYVEQLEMPASIISPEQPHAIHMPISLTEHPSGGLDAETSAWLKTNRNKRMRTSFNEEQVQVLQSYFEIDANPDSAELERIAADVGLPKRVTQVWFQNSRARQKKQQQQNKQNSNSDVKYEAQILH